MRDVVLHVIDVATKAAWWLKNLGAVSIAILMIINCIDIIGTKFFLRSVPGALNISEELMVFLTLLPIVYVTLERGHIRVTLLERLMNPALRFSFEIFQYAVATLITGFVTWRVFIHLQKTIILKQTKIGLYVLPLWPANLVVVISFGFLTIVWMLLLTKTLIVGLDK